MKKIIKLCAIAALSAAPLFGATAQAADYPNRPVKFVVPWPPGDLEDILTRMIAEEMASETGKPASVVNKPGGAGIVGAADVARARNDGLTIGSFVADILTTHLHAGNAPYQKDTFEPVGIFLDYPFVLAVKADAPYNNVAELAKYSQQNKVSLGHFGYQALPTAITFKAAAKENIKFSSDAAFDALDCSTLANGDADVINTTLQLILPCLDDVKVLVSITDQRIPLVPDAPAIGELDASLNIALWNGLFVSKDTPQDVRDKIIAVAQETVFSERAQAVAAETGALVYWQNADESAARVANDIGTMAKIGSILE